MNRLGNILALVMLFSGLAAVGQPRYDRVLKDNLWNGSRNVTGLRQDNISRSFAEVYGSYRKGSLRDTWEAAEGWSAGVSTASIRHLEKISFAGSFSFYQTEGYGMYGSMFIKPGYYPVDLLEFTPGRKSLQTYSFDGGASYDVAEHWRIGAKMDFEAANIAKRKDLRHTNKRLEMSVAPGFMYHSGDFAIGASYIFNKTSETVEAEQIGTSESSYWAFLDKGLMYGVHSVWTGSGTHLDDKGVKGFPVNDFANGIAVQAQWKGLFAEVEYMNLQGKAGEKEYIWFNFPGNGIGAKLGYSHKGSVVRHNALVEFNWRGLEMSESILEEVTENGVNTVINHGSNRILSNEVISLVPQYEIVNEYFELSVGAEMAWKKGMSSQMYPYVFEQSLFTYEAGVGILLDYFKRFDLGARGAIMGGRVDERQRVVSDESGVVGEPFRLEEWYQKSIDYQTSVKYLAQIVLRYKFLNGMYMELDADVLTKGLKYNKKFNRAVFSLRFGYNF